MKFNINFMYMSIGVLSAVLFSSCSRPTAVSAATAWEGARTAQTVAVDTVSVATGSMLQTVNASGIVAGVNEAWLVSETSGIVRTTAFRLGERVSRGQILLQVDDQIARLDMERAKAQYDAAKIEADATEKLLSGGGASPAGLARLRSAESGALAQYESAKKRYEDCTLRAPIQGYIAWKEDAASVGNILAPGTRIARIVDTSSFVLTISVGEREVALLSIGDEAIVKVPAAAGETPITAQIQAIAAASDRSTGSFPILIGFSQNPGGKVRSGMSASVSLTLTDVQPAIVIPSVALIRRGDTWAVFLEQDAKAIVRQVQPSRRLGPRVEIVSGLNEGDQLIISGISSLVQGTPVKTSLRGSSVDWE